MASVWPGSWVIFNLYSDETTQTPSSSVFGPNRSHTARPKGTSGQRSRGWKGRGAECIWSFHVTDVWGDTHSEWWAPAPPETGPCGNPSDKCPIKHSEGLLFPEQFYPRVFMLLTLLTPVFTYRASPPSFPHPPAPCGDGEDARPPSSQTGDTGCERESRGLVCWPETRGRGTEARAWIHMLSPERCPHPVCPPTLEVSTVVSHGGPSWSSWYFWGLQGPTFLGDAPSFMANRRESFC